ncbi:MAG: hypothetical protein IAI50_12435 [Candidatus Eremiobacteraeota bacterium]|nr:hypothetical protein [Candidatus Eremiobacteraeota bacterium]
MSIGSERSSKTPADVMMSIAIDYAVAAAASISSAVFGKPALAVSMFGMFLQSSFE